MYNVKKVKTYSPFEGPCSVELICFTDTNTDRVYRQNADTDTPLRIHTNANIDTILRIHTDTG